MSVHGGNVVLALVVAVLVGACTSAPPAPTASPAASAVATPVVTAPGQPTNGPTSSPTAVSSAAPTIPPTQEPTTAPSLAPSPGESVEPTFPPEADLAAELVAPGTLTVCLSLMGAPAASIDDQGEPDGYNVAFGREIASRLGLEAQFQQTLFDDLLSKIQTHGCDVSISSQNITAARLAEMTLVPYTRSRQPVVVGKGNPASVRALTDLCGLSVSATTGTTHVDLVNGTGDYAGQGLNEGCATAGKDPIDLHTFPSEDEAVQALLDGAVVAYLGNPSFVYDHPDDIEFAQAALPPARQGIAIALDHPVVGAAVQAALDAAIKDGTYLAILHNYLPNDESVDVVSIIE